ACLCGASRSRPELTSGSWRPRRAEGCRVTTWRSPTPRCWPRHGRREKIRRIAMMSPTGRSGSKPSGLAWIRTGAGLIAVLVTLSLMTVSAARAQQPDGPALTAPRALKGDLDAMIKRGRIRVLVVYSKTFYSIDRGRQKGLTYDALQAFEHHINTRLGNK